MDLHVPLLISHERGGHTVHIHLRGERRRVPAAHYVGPLPYNNYRLRQLVHALRRVAHAVGSTNKVDTVAYAVGVELRPHRYRPRLGGTIR
eukprot:scaffold202943_cov27-Prasinocladus_malaysianus.AAC.1